MTLCKHSIAELQIELQNLDVVHCEEGWRVTQVMQLWKNMKLTILLACCCSDGNQCPARVGFRQSRSGKWRTSPKYTIIIIGDNTMMSWNSPMVWSGKAYDSEMWHRRKPAKATAIMRTKIPPFNIQTYHYDESVCWWCWLDQDPHTHHRQHHD